MNKNEIINKIKYEVKRDLEYLNIKSIDFMDRDCMMIDPLTKYGRTRPFEKHVMAWYDVYIWHLDNKEDESFINASINKWIDKMLKTCEFTPYE